jgi:nucleoid-associated protein YejK
MTIKQKLDFLTKSAGNSGQSEFKYLMEFLNDQVESVDHGQENKQLLLAICDEFIEHATYIKKELSKCQK